jgi:nucleotide-binding universal stress UspA family protein
MKLLAILVSAKSAPACLDAATQAARSLPHASIKALHVTVDPEHMVAASEEIELQRLRARAEGSAVQRAEATHAAFIAWSVDAGDGAPDVEWKNITGAEEATVCQEAKAADVIVLVLARDVGLDAGDALHAAIFRSGKPVLVVPSGWRGGARASFDHVAVGLDDSEAARHAIEGAGPWLRAARRVTAIRIGQRDEAALGLTHLLSEAGTEPDLHVVPRRGSDLGAQIVAEAKAIGADMLVTGAYRHSQIVEWILGGTTRHILAAADLPLLLAH